MKLFKLLLPVMILAGCATTKAPDPGSNKLRFEMEEVQIVAAPRVYGITGTNQWGKNRANTIASMKALPHKMTIRVPYDEKGMTLGDLSAIFKDLHPVSYTMVEVLDSYYVKDFPLAKYTQRTADVIKALGANVDWVEVCNECNGDWLGKDAMAKAVAAFDLAKAAGKTTVLTVYLDCPKCIQSSSPYQMMNWVKLLPERVRLGVDHVLVSYYEVDNQGWLPDWNVVFDGLAKVFPNSMLGVGECGDSDPAKAPPLLARYYRDMKVSNPKFEWGGFFWYYDSDGFMVPMSNRLFGTLKGLIQ